MMNSSSLFRSFLLASVLLATAQASDVAPRPLAPARGHYAKLAQLSPAAAPSGAELDAQRFSTDPAFMARVEAMKLEFVQVPLDAFVLPPLPANSSAQTRAEIDYLLRLQASRTETEGERALYFAAFSFSSSIPKTDPRYAAQVKHFFWVGRSIGSWFTPENLPVTTDLIARVWRDASHYMWRLKFKHARIRPVAIDPTVKNLQDTGWAAFPSGHSSFAHMLAYLYSELAPEFSDIFLKDARDIAHSREIIGVHFPSDSESGRVFARQFVNELFKNEAFRAEFAQMRAEWERVRAQSAD
jgi:acid phosphatase (class A)